MAEDTQTQQTTDTQTPPPEGDQQQQQQDTPPPKLYAGKYESPEALETGIREIAGKVGYQLPGEDQPLFGEGGYFGSEKVAEDAYKAMQRMLSRQGGGDTETATDDEGGKDAPPADPKKDDPPEDEGDGLGIKKPEFDPDGGVDQVLARVGLENEAIVEQWTKEGKLTDEMYGKFVEAGIPKGVVDTFLSAQQAAVTQAVQQQQESVFNVAGGEQQYRQMQTWAASNLTDKEAEWFNGQVEGKSATTDSAARAVEWLSARYQKANGNSKPLVAGERSPGQKVVITNAKEYFETHRKARRGDKQAQELLLSHKRNGGRHFA